MAHSAFKFKKINEPDNLAAILGLRGKIQTAINMGVGNNAMIDALHRADAFINERCHPMTLKQISRTDEIRRRSAAGMMGKVTPRPMKDADVCIQRLLALVGS